MVLEFSLNFTIIMNYAQHNSESYLKVCTHTYYQLSPWRHLGRWCFSVQRMSIIIPKKKIPEGKKKSKLKTSYLRCLLVLQFAQGIFLKSCKCSSLLHANMITGEKINCKKNRKKKKWFMRPKLCNICQCERKKKKKKNGVICIQRWRS